MDNREVSVEARRRFIALVGGGVLLAPLVGLTGCGGDEETGTPAATGDAGSTPEAGANQSAGERTATDTMSEQAAADDAQAGSQEAGDGEAMPKLSEDAPQAKRLAYVHNADDVIASEQPRYEEGQKCSNCQLYQGAPDEEWAGCPLFAGKLVKGTGWCNAYAPRSG